MIADCGLWIADWVMRFGSFPWWWPMMAEAAPPAPDPVISGNWLVNALVILIPVIAAAFVVMVRKNHWKAQGTKEEAQKRSTTIEGQPIGVTEMKPSPTWQQHHDLTKRVFKVEESINRLSEEQARQFRDLLSAGHERELRIMDKIDDVARAFHSRVDALIDAPSHKPRRAGS